MKMLLLAFVLMALPCCGSSERTGPISPSDLPTHDEKWKAAWAAATPDLEASRALAKTPPGARVLVVLGTWCGDSRREVSRFAKALERAGDVPFVVEWINVDRNKSAPDFDAKALDIRYVPTFIVTRDGREVGRVVESSPSGIERDIGALLRGEKSGTVTARPSE